MEIFNESLLKMDVINGSNKIYKKGLVHAGEGNMSVRVPWKDEIFITPTFNQYEGLRESDIVHLKFDGTVLSGEKNPSSEYRLHLDLYQARPKVMAVIHTHSPYATMMSVARKRFPILLEEQVIFLGGSVNVSEFAVAHSKEFSAYAINGLETKNGTLMANHGVLVCGRTMNHAVKMAELVEKLAFIYVGAEGLGVVNDIAGTSCLRFHEDFEDMFATHSEETGKCD